MLVLTCSVHVGSTLGNTLCIYWVTMSLVSPAPRSAASGGRARVSGQHQSWMDGSDDALDGVKGYYRHSHLPKVYQCSLSSSSIPSVSRNQSLGFQLH